MESYKTRYKDGMPVFSTWDGKVDVYYDWLFFKLGELGCKTTSYGIHSPVLNVYCNYPKNNYVAIKKFFYDNYPYVLLVEPRRYGIRIHFNTKVTVVYNLESY